jgi:pimeloyl-ACP methyl ester carboxylesterase
VAEKTCSYQSSTIFYRSIGKGKPVVLIHGFAEDGDIWKEQVEFLEEHFHLIVPDLPGSGRSSLISDMSMEGMAEVIHALLTKESIAECTIMGHSMGGYISLAFAEKYPQMLSSFALVHSSAFADSEEKKANRLKSIEFVKKNGAHEFLKATIFSLYTEAWVANNRAFVEAQVEKSRAFTDEAIIRYYQAMINRPDRASVLKNFHKPILFIIGEHDQAVPFSQSMQQCYLPDESHVHILRDSAHMGMLEETDKLNQALLHF